VYRIPSKRGRGRVKMSAKNKSILNRKGEVWKGEGEKLPSCSKGRREGKKGGYDQRYGTGLKGKVKGAVGVKGIKEGSKKFVFLLSKGGKKKCLKKKVTELNLPKGPSNAVVLLGRKGEEDRRRWAGGGGGCVV